MTSMMQDSDSILPEEKDQQSYLRTGISDDDDEESSAASAREEEEEDYAKSNKKGKEQGATERSSSSIMRRTTTKTTPPHGSPKQKKPPKGLEHMFAPDCITIRFGNSDECLYIDSLDEFADAMTRMGLR